MKRNKKLIVVCLAVAFLMVFTATRARAEHCCFNPVAFPFLVAGAVVGTAAAITTGVYGFPYYSYYADYPRYYSSIYYAPPPLYYGSGYYAPFSYYYGPRYRHQRYYGSRPYWGRPGWGHGGYHRSGDWGHRHHRSPSVSGAGRYARSGGRPFGR